MSELFDDKMTARIEGDFVVFLIGARVNRWWKPHRWLPLARAMPRMIRELQDKPELGLLGVHGWTGRISIMVQYWRSIDHLMDYARGKHNQHLPAWKAFHQKVGLNGDVGLWHETFMVKAGNYESVYSGMPRFGLAAAGQHVPAIGHLSGARGRLAAGDGAGRLDGRAHHRHRSSSEDADLGRGREDQGCVQRPQDALRAPPG